MAALLQITGASKHFGGVFAVEGVDLTVETGEIHCLIGPNGAGKSTLFKLVVGTYPLSAGRIVFRGGDISHAKPFARVTAGMSIKLQAPSVFKALPVRRNLHIALQDHVGRTAIKAEEDRLLDILGLTAEADRPAGLLSHGQQQWLEIGMALALQPTLLLLDEPTAGMSPVETERTGDMIQRLNAQGMTMLVVEHDMTFVRQIAQRITVLHLGRVFAQGGTDTIIADPRVEEIYLGKGHVG
jgi:branched-chain amino acid transport system ATP-binding protein